MSKYYDSVWTWSRSAGWMEGWRTYNGVDQWRRADGIAEAFTPPDSELIDAQPAQPALTTAFMTSASDEDASHLTVVSR